MDLAQLQEDSYRVSRDHGFWSTAEQQNIPSKIALAHSELSEALQCYREGQMALTFEYDESAGINGKPEGFGVELADAIIRICDIAEYLGIDLTSLIELKQSYNEGRPHMHGRRV
jgi:NTP pyrophosphatase (non-canonical NTP hydrolase)